MFDEGGRNLGQVMESQGMRFISLGVLCTCIINSDLAVGIQGECMATWHTSNLPLQHVSARVAMHQLLSVHTLFMPSLEITPRRVKPCGRALCSMHTRISLRLIYMYEGKQGEAQG